MNMKEGACSMQLEEEGWGLKLGYGCGRKKGTGSISAYCWNGARYHLIDEIEVVNIKTPLLLPKLG